LDGPAKYVRVFTFDFSKAFVMVSHNVVCSKLKKLPVNPYVINWITDFLNDRSQRVVVDGQVASFLPSTRGGPRGGSWDLICFPSW
jgi:hypothetical protein